MIILEFIVKAFRKNENCQCFYFANKRSDGRLKSYVSCYDPRAWSSNEEEKHKYFIKLFKGIEDELPCLKPIWGRFIPVPILLDCLFKLKSPDTRSNNKQVLEEEVYSNFSSPSEEIDNDVIASLQNKLTDKCFQLNYCREDFTRQSLYCKTLQRDLQCSTEYNHQLWKLLNKTLEKLENIESVVSENNIETQKRKTDNILQEIEDIRIQLLDIKDDKFINEAELNVLLGQHDSEHQISDINTVECELSQLSITRVELEDRLDELMEQLSLYPEQCQCEEGEQKTKSLNNTDSLKFLFRKQSQKKPLENNLAFAEKKFKKFKNLEKQIQKLRVNVPEQCNKCEALKYELDQVTQNDLMVLISENTALKTERDNLLRMISDYRHELDDNRQDLEDIKEYLSRKEDECLFLSAEMKQLVQQLGLYEGHQKEEMNAIIRCNNQTCPAKMNQEIIFGKECRKKNVTNTTSEYKRKSEKHSKYEEPRGKSR